MTELQLGKYEFYPYEFDKSETPTLQELMECLEKAKSRVRTGIDRDWVSKAKAKTGKDVKTPSRSIGQRRPRRKRRG